MESTGDSYKTFAQDHQDEFVLRLFHEIRPNTAGTFLDVGCQHGMHGNNTLILEGTGWTGTLVSEAEIFIQENQKFRQSDMRLADLSACDWRQLLGGDPISVDYLSFLPRNKETFQASLLNFPWDRIRFSVCTLRHWSGTDGTVNRDLARSVLKEHGYFLLAGDVCERRQGLPYEDWFIDPVKIPEAVFSKYVSDSVRAIEVFYTPKVPSTLSFRSCSSDLQDEFVHRLFLTRDPEFKGTFLDIGCGNGYDGNNTYLLEQRGWTGFLVDIDQDAYLWNSEHRTGSKSFCQDVTTCDWNIILGKEPTEKCTFDYISFDVDEATSGAVNNFPWDTVRFRVITIEHDTYRFGPARREYIRELLSDYGYLLVAGDVCAGFNGGPFEDWFVDPKTIPEEDYEPYMSRLCRAIDVLYEPKA
jgi:SAM-dependent methyltransferase